jgi:acetoin utilization protein AcuB
VETAAQIIHHRKIGGLPVVDDGNRVVGILTVTDILGAFIKIMGILGEGFRLDVNVGDEPKGFEKVFQIIHNQGGEIMSVGISPDVTQGKVYYLRLKDSPVEPIVEALNDAGYEVLSSPR